MALAVVFAGLSPRGAQAQSAMQARSADDFVETIGVSANLTHGISQREYETTVEAIGDLGVRYNRQTADIGIQNNPDWVERLKKAHRKTGVKFNLLASYMARKNSPAEVVALIKELGPDAVASVEGTNEPDAFNANNPNWPRATRDFQCRLYRAINSDPATRDIPVLAPSVTGPESAERLGNVSSCADVGNLHQYYAGRNPETAGWGGGGYGSIQWNRERIVNEITPGMPYQITEAGWRVDPDASRGTGVATEQATTARYLPRLFLEHFRRTDLRVQRIFKFDMLGVEDGRGLLRDNGSRRPSFHAVKNLISILEDPGSDYKAEALPLAIGARGGNVNHVLLQKRSGAYYLALWRPVVSEQANGHQLLNVTPLSVMLRVGTDLKDADVWELEDDGSFEFYESLGHGDNTISLEVDDRVKIVRLTPTGAGNDGGGNNGGGNDGGDDGDDGNDGDDDGGDDGNDDGGDDDGGDGDDGDVNSGAAPVGEVIWLKAKVNGKYVAANAPNDPLEAEDAQLGAEARYEIVDAKGTSVCLRSVRTGQFVTAEDAGKSALVANRGACRGWERFEWVEHDDGSISLKAKVNGKYVAAESAGRGALKASRPHTRLWEKFTWESVGSSSSAAATASSDGASAGENAPKAQTAGAATSGLQGAGAVPETFALEGGTPNPFRSQTRVAYALPEAAEVQLDVYDTLGRKVRTLVGGERQPAGQHQARFEADGLASGVYFVRMEAEGAGKRFQGTKKIVLVK